MSTFASRMVRAARLEPALYEEVEADNRALGQATLVVILASLAAGIGTFGTGGVKGLIFGTISALLGWYVWAFLAYFIGTRLLPTPETQADQGELLRTLGFASSPGLIRVLGVIKPLNTFVLVLASVWMLVAMVIAVRQALDYRSTLRAVGVCIIGWLVQAALLFLVTALFGRGGAS